MHTHTHVHSTHTSAKHANLQRCIVSNGQCGRFFPSSSMLKVNVPSASRSSCFYIHFTSNTTHAHANTQTRHACLQPPRAISSPSTTPPPLHPLTSIEKINAIHYHHRREEIQGQKGVKRLASPLLTHSSHVVTSGTGGR